ncbi:DUF7483 domain-containing protein [Ferrovibrio xuzhouensis]|uniref:DUF7483 domain-containing protein n=1 Tax=Ferrovibrio xuzhouensis TaxID=1576914 RepID=A0ABV7VB15_9PROT
MHEFILPHAMGGCAKFRVKRSVLARAAGTTYAQKTFATAGNTRRWTVFMMLKRASLADGWIFTDGSASNTTGIGIVGDRLTAHLANAGGAYPIFTSRLFRDPTAWLPFTWRVDTDQAVAADRNRLYVGLDQITDFNSATYPAVNFDTRMNTAIAHQFGRNTSVSPQYFDGYIALFYHLDGVSLGPEAFLATDPRSGNLMPVIWTGDAGKNGHLLNFTGDAGDLPATVAEGFKDRALLAANHVAANDWTPANFIQSDFVKDTPTNYRSGTDFRGNCCIPNLASGALNGGVVSEGGLKFQTAVAGLRIDFNPSLFVSTGQFFHEGTAISNAGYGSTGLGIVELDATGATSYVAVKYAGNGADYATYGIYGVAADVTAGKIWLRSPAGAWIGGGDPVAGTLPTMTFSPVPGRRYGPITSVSRTTGINTAGIGQYNFGQRDFSIAAPAGFRPWCMAAVARPAVVKAAAAVARAAESGSTIEAALAAKRLGWPAYIEVFKRTDVAEGWRYRFSDDFANALDTSSTGIKVAFPALTAGGQYVGLTLRVDPAYGIATGEIDHVNGVATTVADGLGTSRKVVILKRVDGAGGRWPFFHPDLAAGKLFYMDGQDTSTADTSITSVTAAGFDIGAAAATGRYRYIVLADGPVVALRKFTGTATAWSPFINLPFLAGIGVCKVEAGGYNWIWNDAGLPAYNPAPHNLIPNLNSGDIASNRLAFFAAGAAPADNTSNTNASGAAIFAFFLADQIFATGDCAAQGTAR